MLLRINIGRQEATMTVSQSSPYPGSGSSQSQHGTSPHLLQWIKPVYYSADIHTLVLIYSVEYCQNRTVLQFKKKRISQRKKLES